MAKKPDITTIASGYYSRQALNSNFENLQTGFDNTLSLDGSTPNAMGADLDMNNNDILNANQIDTDTLFIGGLEVSSSSDVNFQTIYLTASYVGDGSTVAYSLAANPQTVNNVNVYVDGVYQNKSTFTLSGTTVTFSMAPPLNAAIEIVYPTNTDTFNGSAASAITYNQGGTGAQDRTVKAKLQETVSVKDFGAVGDGVTDDTAAIQAAINYAANSRRQKVIFPSGHYVVTTLYDHYDAVNNPNYPSEAFRQGGVALIGEKPVTWPQLANLSGDYNGVLIRTTDAVGPALKLGNGGIAGPLTNRRTVVNSIAFMGTCTGSVVELDNATQHLEFGNCTVYNKGGAGGKALYSHNGLYTSKLFDLHISSDGVNGDGLVVEEASLVRFETINVTNCGGTAGIFGTQAGGFGTGCTWNNCQWRKSSNGLELIGVAAAQFSGMWCEQNKGAFDIKIHGESASINITAARLVSTELTEGHILVGGNSGVLSDDAAGAIEISSTVFAFVGSTVASNIPAIRKTGACETFKLRRSSFNNNGGVAIMVDTTLGVTPTEVEDCNFGNVPVGRQVVDQSAVSKAYLVRGIKDRIETITTDLNMSSWTHLPDKLVASTTGGSVNITLPTNCSGLTGKTFSVSKSFVANNLTITGNVADSTGTTGSFSVTSAGSAACVLAYSGNLYLRTT